MRFLISTKVRTLLKSIPMIREHQTMIGLSRLIGMRQSIKIPVINQLPWLMQRIWPAIMEPHINLISNWGSRINCPLWLTIWSPIRWFFKIDLFLSLSLSEIVCWSAYCVMILIHFGWPIDSTDQPIINHDHGSDWITFPKYEQSYF